MKPHEGVFLGQMSLTADQNWNQVQLQARVDDLTFSSQIQKLMTNGGEIGSMSADLVARFQKGEMKHLSGELNTSEMLMENMRIRSSRFRIQTRADNLYLDAKMQGMEIPPQSPAYPFLARYISDNSNRSEIKVSSTVAKIKSHFLSDMWFEDLQMKFTDGSMNLVGGWDQAGLLKGRLNVHQKGKHLEYVLMGHRDQPDFQIKK